MKLDKHSSVPLYFQLKEYILKKIEKGDYPKGGKIPSELDFCDELDLSRPTVRQAVAELVSDGKLQIIKGKGTFVSAINDTLEIRNFSGSTFSFFNDKEVRPDEILEFGLAETVSEEITKAFGDPSLLRDGLIFIYKVLSDNGNVYAYIESFIPRCLFPNLTDDIGAGKTMVDMTVNKYAYLPARNTCKVYIASAGSAASHALDIARGAPVLSVSSVLTSRSGVVCEVISASLRSDVCRLSL
ncbi:MAG: GntR family transcriptional regulator [Saccharofermentanales bacterium]